MVQKRKEKTTYGSLSLRRQHRILERAVIKNFIELVANPGCKT